MLSTLFLVLLQARLFPRVGVADGKGRGQCHQGPGLWIRPLPLHFADEIGLKNHQEHVCSFLL